MILFNFGEERNTNGLSVSRGIWVVFTPEEIMVNYDQQKAQIAEQLKKSTPK